MKGMAAVNKIHLVTTFDSGRIETFDGTLVSSSSLGLRISPSNGTRTEHLLLDRIVPDRAKEGRTYRAKLLRRDTGES